MKTSFSLVAPAIRFHRPSHSFCPATAPRSRRRILAASVAALLAAIPLHATTLDLNGVNITLPHAPDFTTSYLSGANNVTNSGANATLSEGGGPAAPLAYTGAITDGSGTVALIHTGGTTIINSTGNTYSGGTTIQAGLISINNGSALGVGNVSFDNNSALLATANLTLAHSLIVNTGDTASISAATGATLTVAALQIDASAHTVFGSVGQTGVVTIGPNGGTDVATASGTVEALFGTLRNGGGLGFFTSSAASTFVDAGATLDVHDSAMEIANLQGAGNITLGANAATVLTVDAGVFNGVVSGAGQLSRTIAGTLTLTGANTYTGGTTITTGTLQLGNGGTTGSIVGKVTDNDTLTFNHSNAQAFGGLISGTGKVIQAGSGVLTLTGANTYSGGTMVNASSVSFNNGSALGAGTTTLNNGTALLSTATATLVSTVNFASGASANISTATGTTLTLDGLVFTGNNAAIFGSTGHAGVIVLGPAVGTFSIGATTTLDVAFGTLRNGSATAANGLGSFTSAATSTTVNTGATLDVHDLSMEVANLQGAGAITLGANAATVLTVDAGSFSGIVSGAGQLAKTTAGTLTLTGANTYTGGTTITTGTLQIGNGSTTGSIVGNVIDKASLVFDHSNALTYAGLISGAGTVTQAGTGTLTLTGSNTYSGGTMINSGVVSISQNSALGTGAVTLNTGGALLTTANLTLANQVDFTTNSGAVSAAPGTTLTLPTVSFGTNGRAIFGSTGHTGVVVVGDTGSTTPSTVSTLEVAFGTLRNGGPSTDGLGHFTSVAVSTTVDAGATLDVHDFNMEIKGLLGAGAITLGASAGTVLTVDTGAFSGVISGKGQLTKTATGNLTLTGANTYTGVTTITTGTLQLGNGGATGSIVGNVIDKDTLTFNHSNALTFGGVISDAGKVTQAGTGILTLTGANSYSGGTTANAGGISINNPSALGTSSVTLNNGSSLLSTASLTLANLVTIGATETGIVSAASGTTLTLDGLNLSGNMVVGSTGHTGVVTIGPATVGPTNGVTVALAGTSLEVAFGTLRNAGGLGFLTGNVITTTVNAGATLDFHDSASAAIMNLNGAGAVAIGANATTVLTVNAGNFSGVIGGAGQLTKATAGTLTLAGANTYTGGTTITTGILQIGNGGTTGSVSGNIADNATLSFNRSNAITEAGIISGGGVVSQVGTGLLTLTGANTYIGGTTIKSGGVAISNAGELGTGAVSLFAGGSLLPTASLTLSSAVAFNARATVAAASGTTLTLDTVQLAAGSTAVFGAASHTGVVLLGPNSGSTVDASAALEVAAGTLRNGGLTSSLGFFTKTAASTTVDAGATLDVHDFNIVVAALDGAGSVTLGTNTATTLTVDGGSFGGVISGAGQLIANPSSFFSLAGANTYTGGTTISTGSLRLGNGGNTGSIVGNVLDNANLTFDRGNALTFAGVISGSGTVTQAGSGVLTLTGANSYTGGTLLNAGTLSINNTGALGTGNITVNNGGSLLTTANLTVAVPVIFSTGAIGAVSAATGTTLTLDLTQINANARAVFGSAGHTGVIILGPDISGNTGDPTGQIEVAFGTLRNTVATAFFSSTLSALTVDAGATLDVHDTAMTVLNLQGAGNVTLGTSPATVLTLNSGIFGGVIGGPGKVTKASSGALVLSKASTYTGGTTLSDGVLLANNPTGSATGTGPVAINSGATLGGSGTISGALTLNTGGTVAPGIGSPGVAGTKLHATSLLWNAGATLTLQVGVTNDELLLTGALTKVTAGTYTIDITNTGITKPSYVLATFASTTFAPANFTLDMPTGYTGHLVETATSLTLDIDSGGQQPSHSELTDDTVADTSTPPTFDTSSTDLTVTPTPEPTSAALLAFGVTPLLAWRRRHRV